MKNLKFVLCLALILSFVMSVSVIAAEPSSFLTQASQGERFDFGGDVGYEFILNEDVIISALGRPDNSNEGGMKEEHTIYIWQVDTEELIVSATVTPDSPVDALGFRTVALDKEYTLLKDTAYRIVSTEIAGGDSWYDIGTAPDGVSLFPGEIGVITGPKFTETNGTFPSNVGPEVDENDGYVGNTFYYITAAEAAAAETVQETTAQTTETAAVVETESAETTEVVTTAPQTADYTTALIVISCVAMMSICIISTKKVFTK